MQKQEKKPIYILNSIISLTRKLSTNLYEASQAGVKIKLIVRGMLSLVPGIKKHQ